MIFKDVCQRAGLLSKADLTTGMVGEFPSLQGIMGEEYARHNGERQKSARPLESSIFLDFLMIICL